MFAQPFVVSIVSPEDDIDDSPRIADPDARVLAMLGARSAESSSETAPKPMPWQRAWPNSVARSRDPEGFVA
jgi:hypothetical protein